MPQPYDDSPALDTAFHDHEMAVDTTSDRAWSRFYDKCEQLLGVETLDGNEADGSTRYSIDSAYDFFRLGKSPAEYVIRCGVGAE